MDRPLSGWTARLLGAVCALSCMLLATSALAQQTVTELGDSGDGTCDASCTLRDAVLSAGIGDTISFALSGSAPWEISLVATLDVGIEGVVIDALTCCGTPHSGGLTGGLNSSLAVRVVADSALTGSNPLILVSADDVVLSGLNVDDGPSVGIRVTGNDVTISDCYVGTSIDGTLGDGNAGGGIGVEDASGATIGPGVLVSGNGSDGVTISGSTSDGFTITRSLIGLDGTGQGALPNTGDGVSIFTTGVLNNATIGGATAADGNVISANGGDGLAVEGKLDGDGAYNTLIANNIVGGDATATVVRGNGANGILLLAEDDNVAPNQLLIEDNVIVGNGEAGIRVEGANLLEFSGNAIGTNLAGVLDLGNLEEGMYFVSHAAEATEGITVGGPGDENLIAFNGGDGVRIRKSGSQSCEDIAVLANAIWDNSGIGIDLEANAVGGDSTLPAALDCVGSATYGNGGFGAPTLTTAVLSSGFLNVAGTICSGMDVDIYLASGGGADYGQPLLLLDSETCTGTGTCSFNASYAPPGGNGVGGGAFVTAVAHEGLNTTQAALNLVITAACDLDGDGIEDCSGVGTGPDCDDGDATVYPGAPEVCDAKDNNCDGSVDEEDNADGDPVTSCGPDGIPGNADDDCNDNVASIYPGAPEVCDAVDQDCDGVLDNTFDDDADGATTCGPDGDVTATADNDCDDTEPTIYPGATELCNGVDDDCDGAPAADEVDADGDLEMICAGDCNDAATAINTSATEVCDIVDNNCDGSVDEGFDTDGDGFTTCGADGDLNTPADNDCDDTSATVNPSGTETCNAIDDDCDLLVDEIFDPDGDGFPAGAGCAAAWGALEDCDNNNNAIFPGALELCTDGIDNDCDGAIDESLDEDGDGVTNCDGDCDDTNPLISPNFVETCDGADTDCDGTIPEDETDDDNDTFIECVDTDFDCDDTAASIYPGAAEICDGEDSDCDGTTPDSEIDDDGDGLNECGDNDCNDGDATIGPGLEELCDAVDNDCDGSIPDTHVDDDEDGIAECAGDCDDTDAQINTAGVEVCDGVDQDCDEVIDNGFDGDADGVTSCGDDGTEGTADDDCNDGDATVSPTATEICDDGIDQDCDGADTPCAAAADVTLGPMPPPDTGCALSLAGTRSPRLGLLLSLGLLLGLRRRRRSVALLPLAAVLLLSGCVSIDAGVVQTWWGSLPEDGGAVTLEAGGNFAAGALVQPVDPTLVGGRQLLQVILAGDLLPGTCPLQESLFAEAAVVEASAAESVAAGAAAADVAAWACQELRGAAREAFGGDGWRAVHAIVEPADGVMTPATGAGALLDALVPGTYVARMVDLDASSALAPTPGEDTCATRVEALIGSGVTLADGGLLGAALARMDHRAAADDQLARADEAPMLDVGLTLPAGMEAGSRPDTVRLATFVGDDAAAFPDAVVATVGEPLPTEPCALGPTWEVLAIWPELTPAEVTR